MIDSLIRHVWRHPATADDDTVPAPFNYWRCVDDVRYVFATKYDYASISCINGPIKTRAEIRRIVKERARWLTRKHGDLELYLHVVPYDAPVDQTFNLSDLCNAFVDYRNGELGPTMSRQSSVEFLPYIDQFIANNAGRFLRPMSFASFRWPFHYETARELTFVMLQCRGGSELLPDYIVLWIFDWLNAEFVQHSMEHERVELIRGVSDSIKRVRNARQDRKKVK
jgi:hypothetical protein